MRAFAHWQRKLRQLAARLLRIQFDSGVRIFAVFPAVPNNQPVRSILSIRFLSIRALIPTAVLLSAMALAVAPSFSQQAPAGSAPASSPQTPAGSPQTPAPLVPPSAAPGQNLAQTPAPSTAAAPAAKVPDYPDPRTIVFGIYGLYSFPSSGPNIVGGAAASNMDTYENLSAIGAPYRIIPEFEAGVPVTRTGMLYFEFDRYHGWANQTVNRATYLDGYSFNAADLISSTYHIITMRIYLDDLMFPDKFPVARLRFKSIWGLRYISVTDTVDSPTEDAVAGLPGSSFELGTNFILFPEFGAAMEYAIAPHVLFRVDGAGFAIPHHSDLGETSATLSFRKNNLEVLMGAKMLHFKTSPQKEEYEEGTFMTPFVGIRWHF